MTKFIELPLRVQGYVPSAQFVPRHSSEGIDPGLVKKLNPIKDKLINKYEEFKRTLEEYNSQYALRKTMKHETKALMDEVDDLKYTYGFEKVNQAFDYIIQPVVDAFLSLNPPRKNFVIEAKAPEEQKAADEVLTEIEEIVTGFLNSIRVRLLPRKFYSEESRTNAINWLKRDETSARAALEKVVRPKALSPEQVMKLFTESDAAKDFEQAVVEQKKILTEAPVSFISSVVARTRRRLQRRSIYSRRR